IRRSEDLAPIRSALAQVVALEDVGLRLKPDATGRRYLSLESRRMIVEPEVVSVMPRFAGALRCTSAPTFTYLANLTTHATNFPPGIVGPVGALAIGPTPPSAALAAKAATSCSPYAAITALDPSAPAPFGPLLLADGKPAPRLENDEILISDFVA